MIELEKQYLDLKSDKPLNYFLGIVKKGWPLEKNKRYFFKPESIDTKLLERTKNNEFYGSASVVKFLFHVEKYNINILVGTARDQKKRILLILKVKYLKYKGVSIMEIFSLVAY